MLHESALQLFRTAPLRTLQIPFWLQQGKAVLKQQLAERTQFDAASLPYDEDVLAWLRQQRTAGRRIILCTASDQSIARAIAAHCGCFDEVMASDGVVNLEGRHKAQALVQRFGRGGFDYVGNSRADVPVWQQARRAVVVGGNPSILASARASCEVEQVFPSERPGFTTWRRALRVHQWAKNVLLFVALFAAHRVTEIQAWGQLLLAFAAFSLCASSVYIANDLMDLESDRQHPRKRARPFASGAIPAWVGVALVPVLALASLALSLLVGKMFVLWLSAYFLLTWAYSWWLKRVALVDCLTLASLYTLRVVAGAAAAGLALSFWLLAFSGFLFMSLAFVKRYTELQVQQAAGKDKAHGRGYVTSDAPLIQILGVTSGYVAVVVLAMYLNSDAVVLLYKNPYLAWFAVPVIAYWISWLWLCAHRGEMHDDPLVFALFDKPSLVAGALFGVALLLGSLRLPF
jgi:4-hydroxybenzoate polyprenyltransferase